MTTAAGTPVVTNCSARSPVSQCLVELTAIGRGHPRSQLCPMWLHRGGGAAALPPGSNEDVAQRRPLVIVLAFRGPPAARSAYVYTPGGRSPFRCGFLSVRRLHPRVDRRSPTWLLRSTWPPPSSLRPGSHGVLLASTECDQGGKGGMESGDRITSASYEDRRLPRANRSPPPCRSMIPSSGRNPDDHATVRRDRRPASAPCSAQD